MSAALPKTDVYRTLSQLIKKRAEGLGRPPDYGPQDAMNDSNRLLQIVQIPPAE